VTAPFDYLIVVFLSNSFYQNYLELSFSISTEFGAESNKVARNNLYLENLFFAPSVPIETRNFLYYVYRSKSFQHRKEASKLKLAYMTAENESKKNRNGVLLNILLYIVSLFGAINIMDPGSETRFLTG
jgi:hypothetical protein